MRIGMGFVPGGNRRWLRHPLQAFGKVALWLGLGLTLFGVALAAYLHHVATQEDAMVAFWVAAPQGVVWGTLGIIFTAIAGRNTRKLRRLKQHGQQFAADITALVSVPHINYGGTPVVFAECVYLNDQQMRCKVKSSMFLWKNFDHTQLQATVYVDWNNPHYYAVDISQRATEENGVDIDYT